MAVMAKLSASWLGPGENFGDGNLSSGDCDVHMYACAIGRLAGGTVVHSASSSAGSFILAHSANVITREYRNTPVASLIANCPCSASKSPAYANTGIRHTPLAAATFPQLNRLMIM